MNPKLMFPLSFKKAACNKIFLNNLNTFLTYTIFLYLYLYVSIYITGMSYYHLCKFKCYKNSLIYEQIMCD